MKYEQAWLEYKKTDIPFKEYYSVIYTNEKFGKIVESAVNEIKMAFEKMFDLEVTHLIAENAGASAADKPGIYLLLTDKESDGEDYNINIDDNHAVIKSCGEKGILYGTFEFLKNIRTGRNITKIRKEPSNPLRMLNHWDNMDGTIERGYSGESFFFKENDIILNERIKDYARLVSSTGINAVVINNVNVKGMATYLINDSSKEINFMEKLKKYSEIFQNYGIKLFLSLNFAAPVEMGELEVSDPLDDEVIKWWQDKFRKFYKEIPEFGGFLVKADSEGRPGPFTYGRDHADGANMLADAIKPYGGIIIWRCFVYNCRQDWRDRKTDRARSAYDCFKPLDKKFRENVILQIKNGPMDFQIREPVTPLFGAMEHTNEMLEVQIAQEYTGQQKHVCYLIPMFKEVLDFKTYCKDENDTVYDVVSGKTYNNGRNCGIAAVSNTGNQANWTGHDFAAANLYGFGRLAFDNSLTAEEIAKEWIELTFGLDEKVNRTILHILMCSRETYEKYTSPLGIGWMVNPGHHYGPNVDGYEYDRWGTYHRADHTGIGVDRTVNGTGYASLYMGKNSENYEDMEKCPDNLLLFFHHADYTHMLKSGKTVIQHIYDSHFEGVSDVEKMIKEFEELKELVPDFKYKRIMEKFSEQIECAKEWRDIVNSYFYRKSGIGDLRERTIY